MKRCLLTGGAGFIGSNLARRLIAENHDVHLVLRESSPTWRLMDIIPDVTVHILDLRDRERTGSLVRACRPEWIFHLAAYGNYAWQADTVAMFETNVTATVNLLDACTAAGYDSFLYAGSSSEYGAKGFAPCEDTCIEPNSAYAVSKAAATLYCQHIGRDRHQPIGILRLYSVYGPFEEPGRLMPTLILHGLSKKLPPLVAPETPHDFVYVDDVIDAFICAADSGRKLEGEIFNVGSGRQNSIRDIVQVAGDVFGIEEEPRWGSMAQREWDVAAWVCNKDRIEDFLGWRPRIGLPEGFKAMVEWFVKNDHFSSIYLEKSRCAGSEK